mgnify:CR=1 FL=1
MRSNQEALALGNIRYRLARWIAPIPIIADPLPGIDGAVILGKSSGVVVTFRIGRLRVKSTTRLRPLEYDKSVPPRAFLESLQGNRTFTRFVGVVAR